MLKRSVYQEKVRRALSRSRAVVLLGPRQCGKTTLARTFLAPGGLNYFDLEDPRDLRRLDSPMTALEGLKGLVVIDEVQRRPELFPVLRVLADRRPLPARFLILGSASPELLRQSSESLAGRTEVITMSGFGLAEVGPAAGQRHWLRGGFPLSFLAKTDADSWVWRRDFTRTFLERDLPQLGSRVPAATMERFWAMTAHYSGQVWNAAEPARSLGLGEPAVRRYLDLLTDVFMLRQLQPWHENLKKRQVKAPKVYFRDAGLLHHLLGVKTHKELLSHPKCGASWEGYVVEEVLRAAEPDRAYFWATHNGAELDLLLFKGGRRIGVECKRTDAPGMTPSVRIALQDLKLDRVMIVYPGEKRYALADHVTAIPLRSVGEERWT